MSPITTVTRELLVRYLQTWAPGALHRGRRAVYAHGYADADDGAAAEAAVRVLAALPDLARNRELSMVAVGAEAGGLIGRLGAAQRDSGAAAGLAVLPVGGGTEERLAVALRAAGASRVPLLAFLDATSAGEPPSVTTVAAVASAGKPADVLLALPPGTPLEPYRTVGLPLVTAVRVATGELLVFGTASGRNLEDFKEELWAAAESAGARLGDPGDPEDLLIDVSPEPDHDPLRRALLARLDEAGAATVTELRTFALTDTVYRAADATTVLRALVDAGTVTRRPEHGRLGGDVSISTS
ncbi:hypothetical protein [Actinoplanes sp. NBRC 101535]|uniref:hypothetical protein n=1 Tax=Actinoplanes sp. NBRC 101535 TaxID=3032196 RepID=UPI0024A28D76|nr:hypothetical protein [Actinoplanes sp. NBRC 101535]GLY05724.1 hypothetical protein Acsp01_61030 [Actinoplanes sp. NBRC 101535]